MTLSVNSTRTLIEITDTLLNAFLLAPASYTNIEIKIYQNNATAATIETYSNAVPITAVTNIATIAGIEYANPSFFSATEFEQGVYHFIITLTSPTEIQTDEGCIFIEEDLACTINTYREEETIPFNTRLNAGINYFMLKNSQSCPCECEKLIDLYNSLITLTDSTTCKTC